MIYTRHSIFADHKQFFKEATLLRLDFWAFGRTTRSTTSVTLDSRCVQVQLLLGGPSDVRKAVSRDNEDWLISMKRSCG